MSRPKPPLLRPFYNNKPSWAYEITPMDEVRFAVKFDENYVIKAVHLMIRSYDSGKVKDTIVFDMEAGEQPK